MSWNAKPSGAYSYSSTEGTENVLEMASILRGQGWTDEASTGAIANSIYEGGLNPWRWQNDQYPWPPGIGGCGLFGFDPWDTYMAKPGSQEMNQSVTTITPGASPNVGTQQMRLMYTGEWGWKTECWRIYWPTAQYPDLYTLSVNIRNQYGSNGKLTIAQYSQINVIDHAIFAFLACFEGPKIPNYSARKSVGEAIYKIITGNDPDPQPPDPTYPPDPPIPEEPIPPNDEQKKVKKGMPIYMMIRKHI